MSEKSGGPAQIVFQPQGPGSGVGLAAIIVGLLGIFVSVFFVPFGLIFCLIALFKRQVALGLVGLLCNIFALMTSFWFWALFGLSWGWSLF